MIKQSHKNITISGHLSFAIAMTAVLVLPAMLFAAEQTGSDGYALLLEQSPAGAGFITPGVGVHESAEGAVYNLRATPKPGYRFLYWLGDVEDTSVNETSVELDSPKIVIAVFARSDQEGGGGENLGISGGGGRTALRRGGGRAGGGAAINAVAPRDYPDQPSYSYPTIPNDTEEIPEPATLLTLGFGSLIAARFRRKKK